MRKGLDIAVWGLLWCKYEKVFEFTVEGKVYMEMKRKRNGIKYIMIKRNKNNQKMQAGVWDKGLLRKILVLIGVVCSFWEIFVGRSCVGLLIH